MGEHEEYGKLVLRRAADGLFVDKGHSVTVDLGAGRPARLDGTVAGEIAVEIESRVNKQIRGAVLDLICHRYPKKLLVLLPVHMASPDTAADQCRRLLGRFIDPTQFRVVLLKGSGARPCLEADTTAVRRALEALGLAKPESDPSGR